VIPQPHKPIVSDLMRDLIRSRPAHASLQAILQAAKDAGARIECDDFAQVAMAAKPVKPTEPTQPCELFGSQ
jgi:hypothetical protein